MIRRAPENNPELVSGEPFQRLANKLLTEWTADMAFTLDRLAADHGKLSGRLDMARVGAFGHSFGGAQALQFCRDDPRCKAAVDVDGAPLGRVVGSGAGKPVLCLLSDHGGETDAESRRIMADIRSLRAPVIVIPGANHFTFSDDGALIKSGLMRGILRLFGKLRIDPRRQLAATAQAVHTFFDAQLKAAR